MARGLNDILPCYAANSAPNHCVADAKLPCYLAQSLPRLSQPSHLSYGFFRKFRSAAFLSTVGFSKHIDAMVHVFLRGAPFQVGCPVVGFYSIFVIYVRLAENKRNKRFGNEAMNEKSFPFTMRVQASLDVSTPSNFRVQNSFLGTLNACFSSYSSKIRNRINSFVSGNWLPNLVGSVIKWIGHKLCKLRFTDLAPMSIRPLAGVNFFYQVIPKLERKYRAQPGFAF